MTQKIRSSQFVTTYGPGSIIELPEGPAIIPNADIGLFDRNSGFSPKDYKIDDERMSKGLLDGASIYRLPTNSEKILDGDQIIYKTKSFPMWHLCQNQSNHEHEKMGRVDILYERKRTVMCCPICGSDNANNVNPSSPVRFVKICKAGHLDEVDWYFIAHQNAQCTHKYETKNVLTWSTTGGSSLKNIIIACPQCRVSNQFSKYYYNPNIQCKGRSPETEQLISLPIRNQTCQAIAHIAPRQASNIRMPEIKTLLSIQAVMTKLYTTVQNPSIRSTIRTAQKYVGPINTQEKLDKLLQIMEENPDISKNNIMDFKQPNASLDEVKKVIEELDSSIPNTYHELILDEFKELNNASEKGAPPHTFKGTSKPIFKVLLDKILNVSTKKGTKFKIVPINTLQTITVQTGFKRDDVGNDRMLTSSKLISTRHTDETGAKWYPGDSYMGEGIFIRLDCNDTLSNLLNSNESAERWAKSHDMEVKAKSDENTYQEYLFRDGETSKDEMQPGFVWWHTLAHLLIRIISEEAGYSSSSIRERIYFKTDGDKFDGGILLYAAQPGSEGTLGGLTALVPYFKSFLDNALEKVTTCSGDPLCSENMFKHGKSNGVCCDACLMNSETSCEHRNMWLDRELLIDSMP